MASPAYVTTRVCKRCRTEKALTDFEPVAGCRDGRRPVCSACVAAQRKAYREIHRERLNADQRRRDAEREYDPALNRKIELKRRYGLTLEDYAARVAEQGGVCAMCRSQPRADRPLTVDHDHQDGHVRGLLCDRCNLSLGHFERVRAMAETYLTGDWSREDD